eukprot:gb/GECH01008575.1/.p1 GENE.gb/GECH01008575.1/~~gb/GECH01008575.1/.p1  ORF type:complete len:705 (+),score=162.11 gb/GECH01008575.1/:1-2115(+)
MFKKKHRTTFTITLQNITDLPTEGSLVYVAIRKPGHGVGRNYGETKKVMVQNGSVIFTQEQFSFAKDMILSSSDRKRSNYRPKPINFLLKESSGKMRGGKLIGTLTIDLAQYIRNHADQTEQSETLSFPLDGAPDAKINLSIYFRLPKGKYKKSSGSINYSSNTDTSDNSRNLDNNNGSDSVVSSYNNSRRSSNDDPAFYDSNSYLENQLSSSSEDEYGTSPRQASSWCISKVQLQSHFHQNSDSFGETNMDELSVGRLPEGANDCRVEPEDVDILVETLIRSESIENKSAAFMIFHILDYWQCFSETSNRVKILDAIIQNINNVISSNHTNDSTLSRWLTILVMLLHYIAKEYPWSIDDDTKFLTRKRKSSVMKERRSSRLKQDSPLTTLSVDLSHTLKFNQNSSEESLSKPEMAEVGDFSEDEDFNFDAPVTRFRTRVKNAVYVVYINLLSNFYRRITPIVVPAVFYESPDGMENPLDDRALLREFDSMLSIFRQNSVFTSIIVQFYEQIFQFIDGILLRALLTQNRCTLKGGFNMKSSLCSIKEWAAEHCSTGIGQHIQRAFEAANVLIIEKSGLVEPSVRRDTCPHLPLSYLISLVKNYQPDEENDSAVPDSVVKGLEELRREPGKPPRHPRTSLKAKSGLFEEIAKDANLGDPRIILKPSLGGVDGGELHTNVNHSSIPSQMESSRAFEPLRMRLSFME